jgi:hypothetical protein
MKHTNEVLNKLNSKLKNHPDKITITEIAATWMPMLREAVKKDAMTKPKLVIQKENDVIQTIHCDVPVNAVVLDYDNFIEDNPINLQQINLLDGSKKIALVSSFHEESTNNPKWTHHIHDQFPHLF